MSTFCHGVASAQSLDKSSEIVDIKGLDISSLASTGIVNYEHKSDLPGQICGKILTAKKIFDKNDCSNKNETYFWNKTKVPFVYITAELLDDYCQSGKDAAGILRYDHDKKDQNKHAILGFSVEGSEIPNTRGSNKMIVARGIARKVTLTAAPCNMLCIAELLENNAESQIDDDFNSIFKSKEEAITLFKSGEGEKIYTDFLAKKESYVMPVSSAAPKTFGQHPSDKGSHIGSTSTGKDVFSHGKVGEYGFNSGEHKEASELHRKAAVSAPTPKLADNHLERMRLHNQAAQTAGLKENRLSAAKQATKNAAINYAKKKMGKSEDLNKYENLEKSINRRIDPGEGVVGTTESGKTIHNQFSHPSHKDLSHKEHLDADELHSRRAESYMNYASSAKKQHRDAQGTNPVRTGLMSRAKNYEGMAGHHFDQARLHGKAAADIKPYHSQSYSDGKRTIYYKNGSNESVPTLRELGKSIEAGSYNASPSTLVNGAAYQRESLQSKPTNTGMEDHNFQGTKKKDWYKRAKADYERWPHKEKFEKFMKDKMPHLTKGEIRALGQAVLLRKNVELEKSLSELIKSEKEDKTYTLPNALHAHLQERHAERAHEEQHHADLSHAFETTSKPAEKGHTSVRIPHKNVGHFEDEYRHVHSAVNNPAEHDAGHAPTQLRRRQSMEIAAKKNGIKLEDPGPHVYNDHKTYDTAIAAADKEKF